MSDRARADRIRERMWKKHNEKAIVEVRAELRALRDVPCCKSDITPEELQRLARDMLRLLPDVD